MQVIDPSLLAEFRATRLCEWCGKTGAVDPHHIYSRGMGGGSRVDLRVNLVALCRPCHDQAHMAIIPRADLGRLVYLREGVHHEDVALLVARIRRTRK